MQTHGETVFDENGRIKDFVRAARSKGIWMDDCHGRVHWSFENLKKSFDDGFYPDIISSDVVRISTFIRPGFFLLHAMGVNSAAGMDTLEILKAVTYTPAKALGILDKAGTLETGTPADICVMDVRDDDRVYDDWWGGSCKGNKTFVPLMTMKSGTVAYRQIFY
ncbi:MAG: amidohydrolase family protein [Oscillospiraceae bacterium]